MAHLNHLMAEVEPQKQEAEQVKGLPDRTGMRAGNDPFS
jgi:hypothetical protein